MKKPNLMLLVFSLMSFVLAMTAFVFSGILDKVAVSLGISVADLLIVALKANRSFGFFLYMLKGSFLVEV